MMKNGRARRLCRREGFRLFEQGEGALDVFLFERKEPRGQILRAGYTYIY